VTKVDPRFREEDGVEVAHRSAARQRLQALRGTMVVDDVVNAPDEESDGSAWTGDADHC
jgi:hypothetical protein